MRPRVSLLKMSTRILLAGVFFSLGLPVLLLLLVLDSDARVDSTYTLTEQDSQAIEQLILDSAPESSDYTGRRQLNFSGPELDLLFRYGTDLLASEEGLEASARIESDALFTELSLMPLGPSVPVYLNITGEFEVDQGELVLQSVRVGQIELPDAILSMALDRLSGSMALTDSDSKDIQLLIGNMENFTISEGGLSFSIYWEPELVSRIADRTQQLLIPDSDKLLIARHYELISEISSTIPSDIRAISLNTLFTPLFESAHQHSLEGSDPIAENRTLLQALSVYVNNEDIQRILGPEYPLEQANFVEVRLHKRQDLAQHMVSIAAISASTGERFANMLSTTKEAYDARYRSGFSFSDLTANTAGTMLATLATRDNETALTIQQRMMHLASEEDYMPLVGSNRDGLSEAAFSDIYEDRKSSAYQARVQEMEDSLSARPLFAGL